MATLGANYLTLLDQATRRDPNGKTADIVELLNINNEILLDQPWVECNNGTSNRSTMRTGLPTVAWRMLNQGVQPSKSTTIQNDDGTGMLEAFSETDEALVELSNDKAAFRLSESKPFFEAMNQEYASTLFYGDTTTSPTKFLGLAPRYSTLTSTVPTSQNTLSGSGSGSDNTSIWLIAWGDQTVFGTFPQGTMAGLKHEDLGIETVNNSDGSRMRAYRDHYVWKCGLVVRDWRYIVRICNIDVSVLVADSSPADIIKLMIKAMHRLPDMGVGRPVFYMNRTVKQMLQIQSLAKSNSAVMVEPAANQFKTSFFGVPIRSCDAITLAEATVS